MKIGAIIQARSSSTRLPDKILKNLPFGKDITVLEQDIKRIRRSKLLNEIIVATTNKEEDERIINICKKEGILWFKGSCDNVLERHYLAAKENHIDTIVRITSDCPCADATIIDEMIDIFIMAECDYLTNCLEKTYPHGLDIEIFSTAAIEEAYFNANENFEKEHVTPYIYRSHPDKFNIRTIVAPEGLRRPDIRITLDTIEDYALLCSVYDYLYSEEYTFTAYDIVKLFEQKPWLLFINDKIIHKKICNTLEEEINEAEKILELQDLKRVSQYLKDHSLVIGK